MFDKKELVLYQDSNEQEHASITDNNIKCEIGYIGGGNALILFKEKRKAIDFVKRYTKFLLEKHPGLQKAFGFIEDFQLDDFKESMKKLHNSLKFNKNSKRANILIQKHGFTADYPWTGNSAELFNTNNENNSPISAVAYSKLSASILSTKQFQRLIPKEYQESYVFTNDIERFGQKEGLNYIAIVHIDGNEMGKRFSECNSLYELRKLSTTVREATEDSFKEVLETLIKKIESGIISDKNGFQLQKDHDNKTILPVRPIILGGDDVTFVCEGRLGVWLAESYIKSFINKTVSDGKKLSACGGIAVVKTKYPFYRAYKLAEYLTNKSKNVARSERSSFSYIDFLISSSGWTGTEIDADYYASPNGNLHFGPYRIDGNPDEEEAHIDNIKRIVCKLNKFPKNKIAKLRDILYENPRSIGKSFVQQLKLRNLELPKIGINNYHEKLWVGGKTPYFDAIELLDFYPEELL